VYSQLSAYHCADIAVPVRFDADDAAGIRSDSSEQNVVRLILSWNYCVDKPGKLLGALSKQVVRLL